MSNSLLPSVPLDSSQDTLSRLLEALPQETKNAFPQSVEFIKQYAHRQDFLIEDKKIKLNQAQEVAKLLATSVVTTEQGVKDLWEKFPKPVGFDNHMRSTFEPPRRVHSQQMPPIDHLPEMVEYLKEKTRAWLKDHQDEVLKRGWENEVLSTPVSRQTLVHNLLSMHEALSSWNNPHLVRNFFYSPSKLNQVINVVSSLMTDSDSDYAKKSLGEGMSFKELLSQVEREDEELSLKEKNTASPSKNLPRHPHP